MAERTALYPGSFDCLTYGHLNLIERCSKLFDRLVVGVGVNTRKSPLFGSEERVEMLRESTRAWPNVEVCAFSGLTVEYAKRLGAQFIIRGLRAVSDFESEVQLALMNQRVNPEIETVFLMSSEKFTHISSSLIKQIAMLGHVDGAEQLKAFVPEEVVAPLLERCRESEAEP